jgi:hypothetical protein
MTPSPQHRRRRIRRTVGAASLATFAVAWGVIAGTGAMGHTTSSTTTTQSAQSAQSSSDDGGSFSGDDGATAAQQSQQQLPQMTTRQS